MTESQKLQDRIKKVQALANDHRAPAGERSAALHKLAILKKAYGERYGTKTSFSVKIKQQRDRLLASQGEIAGEYGIPVRTWIDWEHGRRKPPKWVQDLLVASLRRKR